MSSNNFKIESKSLTHFVSEYSEAAPLKIIKKTINLELSQEEMKSEQNEVALHGDFNIAVLATGDHIIDGSAVFKTAGVVKGWSPLIGTATADDEHPGQPGDTVLLLGPGGQNDIPPYCQDGTPVGSTGNPGWTGACPTGTVFQPAIGSLDQSVSINEKFIPFRITDATNPTGFVTFSKFQPCIIQEGHNYVNYHAHYLATDPVDHVPTTFSPSEGTVEVTLVVVPSGNLPPGASRH